MEVQSVQRHLKEEKKGKTFWHWPQGTCVKFYNKLVIDFLFKDWCPGCPRWSAVKYQQNPLLCFWPICAVSIRSICFIAEKKDLCVLAGRRVSLFWQAASSQFIEKTGLFSWSTSLVGRRSLQSRECAAMFDMDTAERSRRGYEAAALRCSQNAIKNVVPVSKQYSLCIERNYCKLHECGRLVFYCGSERGFNSLYFLRT